MQVLYLGRICDIDTGATRMSHLIFKIGTISNGENIWFKEIDSLFPEFQGNRSF